MAKRLEVILKDPEYREIQRVARARQMSISEWVRQALQLSCRREALGDAGRKLAIIRAAVRYEFPIGNIDQVLAEIEQGYRMSPRA